MGRARRWMDHAGAVADPGFANGGGARSSAAGASIVAPRSGLFSHLHWGRGLGKGSAASPEKLLTLHLNMSTSSAFCSSATYFISKKHCFGAYKTCCCSLHAMHSTETAKGGKHKPVGK